MAFLTDQAIRKLGFKSIGENVQISDKACFYNPGNIVIGDCSRIDDFSILSAGVEGIMIGKHVHIACYCFLLGRGPVILEDYTGISGRVGIYSSSEDYSGLNMTNPTIPEEFRNVYHGRVHIRKHAIVGAGAIILPNIEIGVGCAVAAMSLIKHNCDEFGVYAGVPAKKIGERKRNLLELEKEFLASLNCDK